VRLQFRSSDDTTSKITVLNWQEGASKRCSTDYPKLRKLLEDNENLTLTSSRSGDLRLRFKEQYGTLPCGTGFLDKVDRIVVQWMNLGDRNKKNPDDLFTIRYKIKQKDPGKLKSVLIKVPEHMDSRLFDPNLQ
jgi:hypothetical protein